MSTNCTSTGKCSQLPVLLACSLSYFPSNRIKGSTFAHTVSNVSVSAGVTSIPLTLYFTCHHGYSTMLQFYASEVSTFQTETSTVSTMASNFAFITFSNIPLHCFGQEFPASVAQLRLYWRSQSNNCTNNVYHLASTIITFSSSITCCPAQDVSAYIWIALRPCRWRTFRLFSSATFNHGEGLLAHDLPVQAVRLLSDPSYSTADSISITEKDSLRPDHAVQAANQDVGSAIFEHGFQFKSRRRTPYSQSLSGIVTRGFFEEII